MYVLLYTTGSKTLIGGLLSTPLTRLKIKAPLHQRGFVFVDAIG